MALVILDTQEIVNRYAHYDSLFSFFSDGIRDLVRQAVLWSGQRKPEVIEFRDMEIHWMNSLAGQVTREWEHAIDAALEGNAEGVYRYQMFHQKIDHSVIDMVVEHVESDVNALIYQLGLGGQYQIDESAISWVGDDLMVRITPKLLEMRR